MKKDQNEQKLINYFLENPINREEFNNLYILVLEILDIIKFKDTKTKITNFNMEILHDKDKIHKEINVNLNDKTISISLCKNLTEEYFIATNITFSSESNIEFSKILVKTTFPKGKSFRELAAKKWQYNVQEQILKNFKEIEAIDYTENIQCCSINEIRESENTYIKCLSKNRK